MKKGDFEGSWFRAFDSRRFIRIGQVQIFFKLGIELLISYHWLCQLIGNAWQR
jgi:hypothetical protein